MLDSVFETSGLEFFYTTLVGDGNVKAYQWLTNHYNFAVYPTTFFDGGHGVHVDIPEDSSEYWIPIAKAGERGVPDLDMITVMEHLGGYDYQIRVRLAHGIPANTAPVCQDQPSGPDVVGLNTPFDVQSLGNDIDDDDLYYQLSWGNGDTTEWLGPYAAGTGVVASYSYAQTGSYEIRVRPRDPFGAIGDWSPALTVAVAPTCCVLPADINADQVGPDIADLVYLVTYMFQEGPPPPCEVTADIDGNQTGPDIADLVHLVTYMFQEGPPPADCPQ